MSQASPHTLPSHLATSPPSNHRDSLHSHYAQSRGVMGMNVAALSNPQPPHQPQPHFYGTPDIDLDLQPLQTGMKPGQRGYHFAFDTLPSSSYHRNGGPETVVVAGYEGGLQVHSVSKRGVEPLASLSGLRGGVINAKILPWTASNPKLAEAFPLIAVVVHGPVLPVAPTPSAADTDTAAQTGPRSGRGSDTQRDSAESPALGLQSSPKADSHAEFPLSRGPLPSGSGLPIVYYQTTVEVYSLKLNRHMCTLLEAPKIGLQVPITSPIFQAPIASGAFHLRADAGNIVISSALTGECWIYRQVAVAGEDSLPFVFVAKLWTTMQQSLKGSSPGAGAFEDERTRAASSAAATPPRLGLKQPVLSLSGKWLAYCPAAPSTQIALRATVPVEIHGRAPGYHSMTPPHLPVTTADVDLPQSKSVVNKIMRDATQEIISGAKWVGQQGWQAFNTYWKSGSTTNSPQTARSPPNAGYIGRLDNQFPPTHGGSAPAAVSKEPGLVSVVDITTIGNSPSVHPVTTFAPPLGCSFLSFSPTGLWLFTASTKGDVQTVWDLFRIQYSKASSLQAVSVPGAMTGPRVRQIAQFSRMTVARIVDVAWTKPNGERLAMVTERGTVHLLDLPPSTFIWPPPRRRGNRPQEASGLASSATDGGSDPSASGAASAAVSYASSAITTAFDAARPLLARPRRSSASVSQSASAAIVDHASHGGKIIAAGISHSLGKTGNAISQLRHTGENRVSLPSGHFAPGSACVAWVAGKRHQSLFVLGNGLIRNFVSRTRKKSSGQRVLHLGFNRDFKVPSLPDDLLSPAVQHYLDSDVFFDIIDQDDAGSNTMVLASHMRRPPTVPSGIESSIPHAEIESSAPYQPFHTDRRIALYEYDPLRQDATAIGRQHTTIDPYSNAHDPPTVKFSALTISAPQSTVYTWPLSEDTHTVPVVRKKQKPAKKFKAGVDAPTSEEHEDVNIAQQEADNGRAGDGIGDNTDDHLSRDASQAHAASGAWVFGQGIVSTLVDTGFTPMSAEDSFNISLEETRALPASAIERVFEQVGGDEHIVVTTRRRRGAGRAPGAEDEDGFFEDDCEVLDFADQRV
ncbi:hypothetical protein SEPCBS119000_001801 [Sporothrix epigloea]|uniref:Uncharacterized protein n=1 Tax=Sporothrix epigloea TaxID=1892477 RepID=A0ABP0DFB9_9PEZI